MGSSNSVQSDNGGDWATPTAGIAMGYTGHNFAFRAFIVVCCFLSIHNVLELFVMIFMTFTRRRGLYFWSLLTSGLGIIPYSTGFMLKFLDITKGDGTWAPLVLIAIGWWSMVTGQSLVLWSRLDLVVTGRKGDMILKRAKQMIIVNALCLHIPTSILSFGANRHVWTDRAVTGYNIMEKIQMTSFFVQETILSSIYIIATVRMMRGSLKPRALVMMKQLIAINGFIIMLDLALLVLECASLFYLEICLKGVVYSLKLKLEFAILGKLVKFVRIDKDREVSDHLRRGSVGFMTPGIDSSMDIDEFVDWSKVRSNVTSPASTSIHQPKGRCVSGFEYDLARFEHTEGLTTLEEVRYPASAGSLFTDDSFRARSDSHMVYV